MSCSDPHSEQVLMSEQPPRLSGRYVILAHVMPRGGDRVSRSASGPTASGRGDHYDWMFEAEDHLLTWASERMPAVDQVATVAATQLPPHRLAYLDYEGEISGGRGTVRRIETGTQRLLVATADRFEFALAGGRRGTLVIYRTASPGSWSITFEPYRAR